MLRLHGYVLAAVSVRKVLVKNDCFAAQFKRYLRTPTLVNASHTRTVQTFLPRAGLVPYRFLPRAGLVNKSADTLLILC